MRRSRETTVKQIPGFTVTEGFRKMRRMQSITTGTAFVLGLSAFILVLLRSKNQKRSPSQSRILKLLIGHLLAMIACTFSMCVLGVVTFSENGWAWCSALASLPATTYVLSHGFSYLIFLHRAQVAGALDSKRLRYIWQYAAAGTVAMLCSIPIMFVILRGILLPNGVCVQTFPWWLPVLLMAGDATVSATFLVLFVYPVWKQAESMSKIKATSKTSDPLLKLARKNLLWGALTICTTFASLIVITAVRIALKNHSENENYSLYFVDWAMGPFDIITNMVAALKITSSVWARKQKINNGLKNNGSNPSRRSSAVSPLVAGTKKMLDSVNESVLKSHVAITPV